MRMKRYLINTNVKIVRCDAYDCLLIKDTLKNLCVKVVDFVATDMNGMTFSKLTIPFICIHICIGHFDTNFIWIIKKRKEGNVFESES